MIVIHLASFPTVEDALTWCEERGGFRVALYRGPDGMIRGTACFPKDLAPGRKLS